MGNIVPESPRPLPPALKIMGSLAVVIHLTIFVCLALGAPSGTLVPWSMPMGPSPAEGPQFVRPVTEHAVPYFLEPLHMTHNYHFMSNSTAQPGVYFEVHLKDKVGQRIKTMKFPDEKANMLLRHRQQLLAQGLAQDQPVPPPQGEVIGAPGRRVEMTVWLTPEEMKRFGKTPPPQAINEPELHMVKLQQHLVPRERPVMMPSEMSLTLAKSYARYLCRMHNAASAEVVRHTREPWLPVHLFLPTIPDNPKLVCTFGEFTRD